MTVVLDASALLALLHNEKFRGAWLRTPIKTISYPKFLHSSKLQCGNDAKKLSL